MVRIERFHIEAGPETQKSKKMATIGPLTKTIWITTSKKAWRHAGRGESVRKVNWEKLKITDNKEIFRERVYQGLHTREDKKKENVANWYSIANILISVAEEVCSLEENNTKPWFN